MYFLGCATTEVATDTDKKKLEDKISSLWTVYELWMLNVTPIMYLLLDLVCLTFWLNFGYNDM